MWLVSCPSGMDVFVFLISQFIHYSTIFTDHFDYIKKLIGAESIGIGGDYEGATR